METPKNFGIPKVCNCKLLEYNQRHENKRGKVAAQARAIKIPVSDFKRLRDTDVNGL